MRLKRAVNIRKRFQKSKCKRKKKKKKLNLSLSLFMALLSGTLQLTSNYIPGMFRYFSLCGSCVVSIYLFFFVFLRWFCFLSGFMFISLDLESFWRKVLFLELKFENLFLDKLFLLCRPLVR